MGYEYHKERSYCFTPNGMVLTFAIRDRARELIDQAGAVRLDKLLECQTRNATASNWEQMACVDMLVELGVLRHTSEPSPDRLTQHQTYTDGHNMPRKENR